MTEDQIKELYERIAGELEADGWPKPYNVCTFYQHNYIVWRKGEAGSSLVFSTEDGTADRPIVRHAVSVQIVSADGRFALIDLGRLPIWPGNHPTEILIDILRCFRSVIE